MIMEPATEMRGGFRRGSIWMSVVLFLILSLASLAIASRNAFADDPWLNLTAGVVPILLASLFRKRIGRLGPFAYAGVLVLVLGIAFLFGT